MRNRSGRRPVTRVDVIWAQKNKKQGFSARYIAITAVFLLVCLFYLIKILDIQSDGKAGSFDDTGRVTRTYSVAGVRGEIYDRNGVLLVGNDIKYDVVFEYGAIPDTTPELNRSILDTLAAIEHTGALDSLSDDLYALEGSYPQLEFTAAAKDITSEEHKYLTRILDANKLDVDKATANDLIKKLCTKYRINETLYTPEEIDALLRVRYEMERVQFGYYNPYTLAKDVPTALVSYIEESAIKGVNFKISSERVYHYPGYASHILGRVGQIQESDLEYYTELGYSMDAIVGNSGCEQAFERYLHSQDGILKVVYDKDGSVIEKSYEVTPVSGNDVWLTIDIELQIAAEDALARTVGMLNSANAAASVAIDPKSGALLAVASYPTFDLTQIRKPDYYNSILSNEYLPELNRAISGVYPPGSVYKLGSALAALEEGHINNSSTYYCNKVFPHLHQPTCLGTHGTLSVTEAIKDSCNVFFYYLGMEIGTDSITKYTKPLGLGVKTGIELPERIGTVAGRSTADAWSAGNDLSAAIGQANHGYTPLQLAVYTASIVNGGTRYSAHLLDSVHEFYTENLIYKQEPQVLETVEISVLNRNIILEGMKKVVEANQTIRNNFAALPITVGGKTGTAEVDSKVDYALFSGAAPYDDPEIVAVCIIEEGAAGTNASYTVADIFKAYYNQKNK